MARFKLTRDDSGNHTWTAVGTNPETARQMTIRGGQSDTPVGRNNPRSGGSFDARHDTEKYVNKLRWDNKAKLNSFIEIPDKLFKKAVKKKPED